MITFFKNHSLKKQPKSREVNCFLFFFVALKCVSVFNAIKKCFHSILFFFLVFPIVCWLKKYFAVYSFLRIALQRFCNSECFQQAYQIGSSWIKSDPPACQLCDSAPFWIFFYIFGEFDDRVIIIKLLQGLKLVTDLYIAICYLEITII